MQKLSELFGKICSASERGKKGVLVDLQSISEIRDEFWALEQRASNLNDGWLNAIAERDEARAKLAELAKQKPAGKFVFEPMGERWHHIKYGEAQHAEPKLPLVKLFTRPAPAADLAELVPDEVDNWKNPASEAMRDIGYVGSKQDFTVGANWMRSAILRNIQETSHGK